MIIMKRKNTDDLEKGHGKRSVICMVTEENSFAVPNGQEMLRGTEKACD